MDYYKLAEDNIDAVKLLINGGKYMQAVYYCCLASEMYLKSIHSVIFPLSDLDKKHDLIKIFKELSNKYHSSKDLLYKIIMLHKYFNESCSPAT